MVKTQVGPAAKLAFSVSALELARMVVLAAFTLIFSSVGFTLGWTLRKSEDKQDAAHEQALIEHAVDVTEGKIDKRMRLILACRDVGGPLK